MEFQSLIALAVVGVIVLLFGLAVWASIRQARRRREALAGRGLAPLKNPDPAFVERIRRLHPKFEPTDVYCLDRAAYQVYLFNLTGQQSGEDQNESSMALVSGDLRLPRLLLFPRLNYPLVGRLMNLAIEKYQRDTGLQPVAFPEEPAFEEAYHALGEDEVSLRACLTVDRLARLAKATHYLIQAEGDTLTFSRLDLVGRTRNDEERVGFQLEGAAVLYAIFRE